MRIVADIGGTHARFAVLEDGKPSQIKKYLADSFHTFEEAFFVYCKEFKIDNPTHLAIATAGYPTRHAGQKIWKFGNNNKWIINPDEFSKSGVEIDMVLNDFEGALWGLKNLPEDMQETLYKGNGRPGWSNKCLMGPGTGLGLGYLIKTKTDWHAQRTHGGHIMAAPLTDEHTVVIKTISRMKNDNKITVFENLVSGAGLHNIYQALCTMSGKREEFKTPEEICTNAKEELAADALRLFHEFFGLFAHGALVHGHAYGGLYLTGGVLDHLVKDNLFDVDHFRAFLHLSAVASVQADVAKTPIIYVKNPYLALYGLAEAIEV